MTFRVSGFWFSRRLEFQIFDIYCSWIFKSTGCCVLGECAGTRGNSPGDSKHRGRIVQDSRAWRSDGTENIRAADRRGLNPKAYNNEVACPLVQEIVRAAIAMRDPMVVGWWQRRQRSEVTKQQGRGLSDLPLCRCETAEPTGCLAASADSTQAEPWEHSPGVGG